MERQGAADPFEGFETFDHERHVRRAIALAREATERGDRPFGSVLVRDDEVVMEERNAVNTAEDIRRHPELTLAHRAAREYSPGARAETAMYTSTEPCPMCTGGIHFAGLGAVVYSAAAEVARELAGADIAIPCHEILDRGERPVAVLGPVLPAEGRRVHEEFW